MIQITDLLTDPIVLLYNIGIIGLFVVWIFQDRTKLKKIFTEGSIKNWWIFSSIWFIFSLFANFFVLGSDVDDAIISGAIAFVNGANPYAQKVVVHLLPSGEVLGLYHYFPSDLLVYGAGYLFFRPYQESFPFLLNSWFFLSNCIFLALGYLFTRKILDEVEDKRLLPIYIFVTCFFLFSNSSLLVLYFTMGFYFIKKLSRYNLGITAYILAAGVKYITGLLIFVQIVEEILHVRSIKELKLFIPYITGSIIFFIIILPYGLYNMLNATILYQIEVNARSQVAQTYGPILINVVLILDLYKFFSIIFGIAVIVSILLTWRFGKTTYEREMILSFLFMLILPFYGTELLIVPILLWVFQLFGVELNFPETSSHFIKEANQSKKE